jgi:DNA-binding response OmpR family regulator
MFHHVSNTGFILCVGVPLHEVTKVARLLRDRAVVLAATDVGAARALLAPTDTDAAPAVWGEVEEEGEASPPTHLLLCAGRLVLDPAAREATVDGRAIHLSAREFDLLAMLASDVGRVWSFAELTQQIWGADFRRDRENLVSTVKRLRKKLTLHGAGEVRSVHGIGYRLRVVPA